MTRKNKGAAPLTAEALVRVIIAVLVIILLFPACAKIRDAFFNPDTKFQRSFENFVFEIDNLPPNRIETFSLLLKENSAIIGFSDQGDYKYVSSDRGSSKIRTITEFQRPSTEACSGSSCICICFSGLEIEDGKIICEDDKLQCKRITHGEIFDNNPLLINPFTPPQQGDFRYWKNGFLFGRGLDFKYTGLTSRNIESTTLQLEKRNLGQKSVLGPCISELNNPELNGRKNYRNEYYGDGCIVTEFDEAKQFEKIAEDPKYTSQFAKEEIRKSAIQKYKEFIEKYPTGKEVEEARARITKLEKTTS